MITKTIKVIVCILLFVSLTACSKTTKDYDFKEINNITYPYFHYNQRIYMVNERVAQKIYKSEKFILEVDQDYVKHALPEGYREVGVISYS